MPIYRVIEPSSGQRHLYEWRRGALRTLGLLLLALAGCAMGLVALDNSDTALREKLFRGVWNAANLVTTLGDFTGFDERQKVFMMATMLVFLDDRRLRGVPTDWYPFERRRAGVAGEQIHGAPA